jgi:indoleamine 2,3-dioxygenase
LAEDDSMTLAAKSQAPSTLRETRDELARFEVTPERGFLPPQDPLRRLPDAFAEWEQIVGDLPKLLMTDQLRGIVDGMSMLEARPLRTRAETERAMMLLSYIGHAYVWGGKEPATRLPSTLAVPWHALGMRLGRPPVLSYASYALHNWRRIDATRAIELGNIALLQNFWGGADEEWFILVHVDIEANAAAAIRSLLPADRAAAQGHADELAAHLATIADAIDRMYATLSRMPEFCDPYIYYHRVRPYIHGWKNAPTLPQGTVYEGVAEYAGKPQQFRGETGAQSSIIPALDALLGVSHRDDPLRDYLMEMRDYMPPAHRGFIKRLEAAPSVRQYVATHASSHASLRDAYNRCVRLIEQFRAKHLEYAATYIFRQAQKDPKNPTTVGTGGTPFMPYLKKHMDETAEHTLR